MTTPTRLRRLSSAALLLALASLAAPPASAADTIVLKASGAQVAAGQGSLTEVGGYRFITVLVNVTAGSGTVNPFEVWIEGSVDNGTNWYQLACQNVMKAGATAPGTAAASQRDIVNEVAVVTSAKYVATCEVYVSQVRAAWNISGSTPSETFSVTAVVK
jgi:hypothetical protein